LTAVSEEAVAVIDQINALREEMQILYDEYTKLAQFLRDKIVELGQNLNDHAKKLQEEVAENSQAIIKLETRYLLGEIGAQKYYSERQGLNESIQRNLSGLDEVKNMLAVLGQIEVKPLTSSTLSDYEIGFSAASAAPLSRVCEGVHAKESEVTYGTPERLATSGDVQETPATTPQPTISEAVGAPVAQEAHKEVEASVEVSRVEVPHVTIVESQAVNAGASGKPVQTTEDTADSSVPPPVVGEKAAESVAPQQTSYSCVENIKALPEVAVEPRYLPVSNYVPPEEASVVAEAPQWKSEVGQQAYLEGSRVEVVKAVKLMPYAAFYDVSCPKCGAEVPRPVKSWELKGGKSKKTVMIGLFECPGCRVKFREALSKETV